MRKVSSIVWQFFDRIEENKRCVAVLCKLCDSEYKFFGNTTNLRSHLSKKHPVQWNMRDENWDGKTGDDSSIRSVGTDIENTYQSVLSTKRKKRKRLQSEKNVRYSLPIKSPNSGTSGEDSIPRLEICRIECEESEEENDNIIDDETTHMVRQMHDINTHGSDEEWLDEDYVPPIEVYKPKKIYRKIKREIVSPPHSSGPKYLQPTPEKQNNSSHKDEYSLFGEYIANKLRKLKAPHTCSNVQQIFSTILWQAENGMYNEAESVRKLLLYCVNLSQEQVGIEFIEPESQTQTIIADETDTLTHNESIETNSSDCTK